MSNCKIFRNKDKSINKVMDEFGNESQLYQDTLFYVSTLTDNIPLTPPIKHYLDKGDIMDTSVSEVALGLWAYSYSKHFRDKYNITKSNLEEVSVDDIIRHIEEYYPKPVTTTPTIIQQEVKEGIKPTDRIIWGHPTIGKTTAKKERDFLDFDTDFKPLVARILGLPESQQNSIGLNEWRKTGSEEDFNKAMRKVWEIAKSEAFIQNKMLMVSDMIFLRENQSDFDKVINIPTSTFINRAIQRGDNIENLQNWKNKIDKVLTTIDSNKIITTDKYLSDLFIIPEKKVKEGVEELFESNPELATIGTQEQYSQYLDTIFPDSKVKDIVYHGTDFSKDEINFKTDRDGIFLASDIVYASYFSEQENSYPSLINFNNIYKAKKFTDNIDKEAVNQIKARGYDSVVGKGGLSQMSQHQDVLEYIAFKPEQIHILGSKQDIQGFKKFVSSNVIPEQRIENINYQLKSVNILSSDKADKVFKKGNKNNWDINKILSELNIPKEQQELIKSFNTINREEIISNLLAYYSYAIEINITKETNQTKGIDWNRRGENENIPYDYDTNIPEDIYSKEYNEKKKEAIELGIIINKGDREEYFTLNGVEYYHIDMDFYKKTVEFKQLESPTQYYSSLTVPGGTNYTENEISTPAITPSIKGHAQFATDKGIGWFRSDEQTIGGIYEKQNDVDYPFTNRPVIVNTKKGNTTNTRRILEVQSDLFQKGRDKENLIFKKEVNELTEGRFIYKNEEYYAQGGIYYKEGEVIPKWQYEKAFKEIPSDNNKKENQFLQLLNKDNNWVTFFIKSIIQDSAKKGYEKVLFPSGDTASKVEGHTTLEEFKKEKEDRIKYLEELKGKDELIHDEEGLPQNYATNTESIDNEINQLKQELERVETEGFGALRGVYNFYENVIKNVLNKQYGKENVIQITDEFGNTWNEIEIESKRDYDPIYFQLASDVINPAIEELDNYLLDFLKNFNVKSKQFEELKTRLGIDALGATDSLNKLIWYVKNRNEETLPEESAHMLVALMGEKHPDINELLSNITNWSEYNDIKNQYLPIYKDENKVKIEAVGKLIAKALVKNYKVNGLDKNKLQKALDRILKYIKEILDSMSFNNIFMYNDSIADHIAINVLSGNKDYIYKITNLNPNLNAKEEINNNPHAKKIINKFSSSNVKMTGSLAIAGTENIRRPKGIGIHDIDFKVKSFELFEKEVLPKISNNAVPAHYGWHKKEYSTFAYLIPLEGYRIEVLERKDDFSNGLITEYKLYNEKNKEVEITQSNVIAVDFFVYKEGNYQKDFNFSSDFIPASLVYEGKMSLGGKSNPYFFSRDKDQEDYVLRDPKSFIHFTKHLYYQLPKQVEPTYNPETKSKIELLDEFNRLVEVSEKMGTKYPKDAINKIKSFLQDLNFNLSTVNEILNRRGLNDNPKAVIDFAYNLVAFGDGATVEDFAEEIGHIISLHAPQDKNLDRALEAIKDTQLYKDNYLNYVKTYSKPGLSLEMSPERKAALEVLGQFYGKLLTGTLTEKDMKVSKQSFFTRIMNFVKRMINRTDNFNLRTYLERNRDNFFLEPGKEIKSKEIFYSLEQSENIAYNKMFNAIDNMIGSMKSRMAREIKDTSAPLGEYSKRQANLQTQLALLYQMKENIAYDSAIADFLKSLYVDSANIFNFLEQYFVVKKEKKEITLKDIKFNKNEKIFIGKKDEINAIIENDSTTIQFDMFKLGRLKKDADLSTLHYSQLSELREFLMHYNSFVEELGIANLSNNLLSDSQLDDLSELFDYVNTSLNSIETALNVLNKKKMPDAIDTLIEETGVDVANIPKEIVDALKDTNIKGDIGMMEYLLGTTRDSSQPILRLFNSIIKNIMHIAKRNTLSFAGKFLDKLNHRIGQSMDWAYEKYNDKFTGYLISEYNYGRFKEEKDKFFKDLNLKYEYPVDANAKEVMFNSIVTRFDNNDIAKAELKTLKVKLNKELDANKRSQYEEQIDTLNTLIDNVEKDYNKLSAYRNEINKWYKENTTELVDAEEIIQSVINDPELSSTEKTVWYNNNVTTNDNGDVIGYKNELVRPSNKYINPDYAKLSSTDLQDLNYIKETKKELDKFLPTKINRLAPQTYQSAMDTFMKTQLPELRDKLKFLGKDVVSKKEDDEIGELTGDKVSYEDETRIIKYNPTRYTKLLVEPNNISTDLLSSMIAYAKMVSEFKEKAERIEQIEFIAQNIKNGYTVNTDTNISSPSNTSNLVKQLENYLRVQIMGITYPDVTIPVLNIKPTKLLKNFARFVSLKNLGLNFVTQFVDFTTSKLWYHIETTMGDTVTRKSSKLGYSKFTELAQDSIKESASTIKNNKLSAILRTLGLSDNLHSVFNDLDKNILTRDISNKVLFAGYRASNFLVSGQAALAGMYNFRLYNNKWYTEREFNKIENPTQQFDSLPSAYDNMRVENGLMSIDGMDTKTFNLFTRRMNNLISKIDGKLGEEDKTYAHSTLLGIVTLIHRDWILDGISRRLKKRGFNFDTNAVDEGYWITTARFMRDFFASKDKIKNIKFLVDSYNELDDVQKEGVRRTMRELMVVVGSIALAIIMNLGDDDDDDRDLDYLKDMAAYIATRSTVELTAFYNPFEYLYAATDVFVVGRDLKRIMTFTEMFDAREIESGKWEGWTRSQKYFLQNIPGVNGSLSIANPEASNRYIINNVLGFAGGLDKLKYYDIPLIGSIDEVELKEIEREKR